jgi:hypothetical protein
MAIDDTLDEDAKITILATGFDNTLPIRKQDDDDQSMDEIINEIYGKGRKNIKKINDTPNETVQVGEIVSLGGEDEKETPDVAETPSVPGNLEATDSQGDKIPESVEEPSRAFFNRVKYRFLKGLSSLTKEEE